jgi:hypothetical protein
LASIPFTVYDVFAELAPGFIIIAVIDYVGSFRWILRSDLPTWEALLWIGVAYIVGNIVSNVASSIYESGFLTLLGRSEKLLMTAAVPEATSNPVEQRRARRLSWRHILPGYYRPLPADTQQAVLRRYGLAPDAEWRAVFLAAFGAVKTIESVGARLDVFVTNYGFARNTSLACFIATLVLLVVGTHSHGWTAVWWAIASFAASVGLLYRYLKFYRQYTYEVFVSYAAPGSGAP